MKAGDDSPLQPIPHRQLMADRPSRDLSQPTAAVFTRTEWLSMLLGYALLVLALFTLGFRLNEAYQVRTFEDRSRDIVTTMGTRVGEIRTVLTAIVGMHYVSDGFRNGALTAFAQPLQDNTPYVSLLGRFKHVPATQRQSFEAAMAEHGLYRFAIQHYDPHGIRRFDTLRAHYYPVAYAEPMAPATLSLVGNNLGAIGQFTALIGSAIDTATPFVSQFPDTWPLADQLLLVQPVYRGQHAPLMPDLRRQQADGGYWLAIDLTRIIDRTMIEGGSADVRLSIRNAGSERIVHQLSGRDTEASWLPDLYGSRSIREEWAVGSSDIVLDVTGRLTLGQPFILVSLLSLLSLSLIFALLVRSNYRRRLAERARQHQQAVLFSERERAERTLNALTDVVFSLDDRVCLVHMNPAAEHWSGLMNEAAVGTPLSQLLTFYSLPPEPARFELAAALNSLDMKAVLSLDVCLSPDAETSDIVNLSISRTLDTEGLPSGYIMVMRNVSLERKLTRELEYQARHDPLTGCFNRYHFELCLTRLIEQTRHRDSAAALLYMDLDQFKVVNDTCGHSAGDRLLVELTETLATIVRDSDVLARLGGDEFGLIIQGGDVDGNREVAERIYEMFQKLVFTHEDQVFAVRASLGMVIIDEQANSVEDVLSAADIACYTAKDNGRNGLCVYSGDDESMTRRHQEMNWAPRLQDALLNDRFVLLVQAVAAIRPAAVAGSGTRSCPGQVIGNGDGNAARIEHFEFLLRLRGDEGELISPFQFIQAAERYDLMQQIDRWVIARAVQTVVELPPEIRCCYTFSINISGQSAADSSLLGYLTTLFEASGVSPCSFWFELTETAAISHFSTAVTLIQGIRTLGAKVALDDFGSGLSSFGYLKSLPVDIIKIDGQFVREIADNPVDSEMVRAIDRVGKSMGIVTVAEFVESQAIVDELMAIGIDYAQGYHIGKPCPLSEALPVVALKRAS